MTTAQTPDPFCICGYRQSLHPVDATRGGCKHFNRSHTFNGAVMVLGKKDPKTGQRSIRPRDAA